MSACFGDYSAAALRWENIKLRASKNRIFLEGLGSVDGTNHYLTVPDFASWLFREN